jgi:hypothetical protein
VGLGGLSSTCCEVAARWLRATARSFRHPEPMEKKRDSNLNPPPPPKQTLCRKRLGSRRPTAGETQRRWVAASWPAWMVGFFLLFPSSFLFSFLLRRDSFLPSAAWVSCGRMHSFFFAFFSLYMMCQHVNGGQKTPPFCHIRIEDIPV